jgi:hypothetical protein
MTRHVRNAYINTFQTHYTVPLSREGKGSENDTTKSKQVKNRQELVDSVFPKLGV